MYRSGTVTTILFLVAGCVGVTPGDTALPSDMATTMLPELTSSTAPATHLLSLGTTTEATATAPGDSADTPFATPPAATATPTATPTLNPTPTPVPSEAPVSRWVGPDRVSEMSVGGYQPYPMMSMAIDGNGHAHIAASGIYYLTNRGGAWTTELLTDAPRRGVDGQPSLAIDDTDGSVWIAFTRWSIYDPCVFGSGEGCGRMNIAGVYYTRYDGSEWTEPELLVAGGSSPSLKVIGGAIHLAYAISKDEHSSGEIHYGTDLDGSWSDVAISDDGHQPSLAWQPDLARGFYYKILFIESDRLRYALVSTPDTPVVLEDGPAGTAAYYLPVVLAPDPISDDVHAVWSNGEDVFYAKRTEDGWSPTQKALGKGELGGMAVDSRGVVHIVTVPQFRDYSEYGGGGLNGVWYLNNATGEFKPRQILEAGDWETEGARFPSVIELDANDQAHVAFSWIDEPAGLWYGIRRTSE